MVKMEKKLVEFEMVSKYQLVDEVGEPEFSLMELQRDGTWKTIMYDKKRYLITLIRALLKFYDKLEF